MNTASMTRLLDTGDNAVANGYHSQTLCNICDRPLTDHPNAVEEVDEDADRDD